MKFRKPTITFAVVLVFCAANIYSYFIMPEYSTLDDGFIYFGWPFDIYAEGGFVSTRGVLWTGLVGNVVLALCVARIATKILAKPST